MPQFRKKPVVIEAHRWDGNLRSDTDPQWLTDARGAETIWVESWDESAPMLIETLEGTMKAQIGDWIIRGVNGELYPCKPDIFEKTYEPA